MLLNVPLDLYKSIIRYSIIFQLDIQFEFHNKKFMHEVPPSNRQHAKPHLQRTGSAERVKKVFTYGITFQKTNANIN